MSTQGLSKRDQAQLLILRKRAFIKQDGLCYWCHHPMDTSEFEKHPRRLSADHLIPLHAGGRTVPGNIVAACKQCNSERHPELNRSRKTAPQRHTIGDDSVRSPFEKLRQVTQ